MMKPTNAHIQDFFTASNKMAARLLETPLKSTSYTNKNWQYRISPQDLSKIFQWVCENQAEITPLLQTSPYAVLCKSSATNLYLTFELIVNDDGVINLLLNSKSKLAATAEGKSQKEPELTAEEIKARKKKSKVIYQGGYKEVQYCFQWQPGMEDPSIYAASIFKSKTSYDEIAQEKRFRDLLGKDFSNRGMIGLTRSGGKHYFYAPLAVYDQKTWSEDTGVHGLKGMEHIPFLTVLFKQALVLKKFQQSGIIWRDLKDRNFLMVPNTSGDSLKPIPIDFSHSRTAMADKDNLDNSFGTISYYSPWNNEYISFREIKFQELKLIDELKKQTPHSSKHTLIGIQQLRSRYRVLTEQRKSLYGNSCTAAIKAINSYSKLADLIPPTPYEKKESRFLSSHRDDAWAFSKLMTELLALRYHETKEPKLKSELQEIYDYFYKNMHSPWQEIHSGTQIVDSLSKIFEKMNIRVVDRGVNQREEIMESKKCSKSLKETSFLSSTKKPLKETGVKRPGSFMC